MYFYTNFFLFSASIMVLITLFLVFLAVRIENKWPIAAEIADDARQVVLVFGVASMVAALVCFSIGF